MKSIKSITRESLGDSATAQDVMRYSEALDRILPAFDNEDDASAWLWGNGDYLARIDAAVCAYCGELVREGLTVPDVDHDGDWYRLAREHARGCTWIRTRAHRILDADI